MEFFKKQTNINFLGLRKITAVLSALLFLASILSLIFFGLNWGLDFTGGTQIQVSFNQPAELSTVRAQLAKNGFNEAVVQSYGTSKDILISVAPEKNVKQQALANQVLAALPGASLKQVEFIGPQVGRELANKGALAVLIALIATMIYIAVRFEYRFAVGAAVALIHDPVLILGLFAFFHWEFNLTVLAAVLAVIGYSLNDTIVIFDRIRENFRKVRKGTAVEIVNLSINQTLSRTIMTSATTLMVVLSLYFFGGPMIHGFALALIIGIVVGTYSSIYVAGALAVALGLDRKDLLPAPKQALDDRP
jgi:preprotein translocase subunit SecF